MVFTPIYKLLKHQKNPQTEAVFDLFLDIREIGGRLSKMDVSEIVYNEGNNESDNEESLTDGYYEMWPVLIQANVPTENAANLQNGNYHTDHVDHSNVEYRIQNESRSSSPHIAEMVDHDNIELDVKNEPMPSSAHLEMGTEGAALSLAKHLLMAWRWSIKVLGWDICPPTPTALNIGQFMTKEEVVGGMGEPLWFVAYSCALQWAGEAACRWKWEWPVGKTPEV